MRSHARWRDNARPLRSCTSSSEATSAQDLRSGLLGTKTCRYEEVAQGHVDMLLNPKLAPGTSSNAPRHAHQACVSFGLS